MKVEFNTDLLKLDFLVFVQADKLSTVNAYTVNNYMEIIGTLLVIPMLCIGIIPIVRSCS